MSYCSSCHSNSCGCPTACDPCNSIPGCPVQLDFACAFYHKNNSTVSELDGLGFTNGATLEAIIEAIDEKVKQLAISTFLLPYLRASYVVNTLEQFTGAVDSELDDLRDEIDTLALVSQTSITASDTPTIAISASGTLNHTISADVLLSTAVSGNRITEQVDGLHVAAQTLSVNYTTKTLSITDGNSVSVASLLTGSGGFLGNLASDPTATDGQYWWNTSTSLLRVKVNGTVRTIITS